MSSKPRFSELDRACLKEGNIYIGATWIILELRRGGGGVSSYFLVQWDNHLEKKRLGWVSFKILILTTGFKKWYMVDLTDYDIFLKNSFKRGAF